MVLSLSLTQSVVVAYMLSFSAKRSCAAAAAALDDDHDQQQQPGHKKLRLHRRFLVPASLLGST